MIYQIDIYENLTTININRKVCSLSQKIYYQIINFDFIKFSLKKKIVILRENDYR